MKSIDIIAVVIGHNLGDMYLLIYIYIYLKYE